MTSRVVRTTTGSRRTPRLSFPTLLPEAKIDFDPYDEHGSAFAAPKVDKCEGTGSNEDK